MKPDKIIIHSSATKDSGTVSWDAIRKYHTKTMGWNDIGYHAGVELVGHEYQIMFGRNWDVRGAHTRGFNDDSLGFCCVGDFDDAPPPDEQLLLLIGLVKSAMVLFQIPAEQVFMHRDFTDQKTCPGNAFPWHEFILMLSD